MDGKRLKFVLLGTGIFFSMALLIWAAMGDGAVYYLTVSEFMDQDGDVRGARVNGKVVQGSIERLVGGQAVRFTMSDGDASLDVYYEGIIPDTFVDRAEVVVEGKLGDGGTFEAHNLLAKCPSKYESAEDGGAAAATASSAGAGDPPVEY